MNYAVVTGSSRGLGEAIAIQLMKKGIHIIGVARNNNSQLEKVAEEQGVSYLHQPCDLSNTQEVEQVFNKMNEQIFKSNTESITLINNAGIVEPIDQSVNHQLDDLTNHVNINLLTPMVTTNLFLQQAKATQIPVVVTNVTSGAANRSVFGWSTYCSSKAGLNRFTETVGLEQTETNSNNKVMLFDPGIMDTDMQGQIRSATEEEFKDVQMFKQYKQDNKLRDTEVVASILVDVLGERDQIVNGRIYSVKDIL